MFHRMEGHLTRAQDGFEQLPNFPRIHGGVAEEDIHDGRLVLGPGADDEMGFLQDQAKGESVRLKTVGSGRDHVRADTFHGAPGRFVYRIEIAQVRFAAVGVNNQF